MRTDRLKCAIALLERIRDEQWPFDMGAWCGTACCLYGWMARTESFQNDGWHLDPESGVSYGNYRGYDAGAAYFEIERAASIGIAAFCTYDTGHVTPDDVIARIREIIGCERDDSGQLRSQETSQLVVAIQA